MSGKLALKRLTASDLTVFKYQFTHSPAGKQKAINLNADILVKLFYPAIEQLPRQEQRFLVDLVIYGPGNADKYTLARKVLKQEKNWRLNGELVDNPVDEPGRFDTLKPGDFALFQFNEGMTPQAVSIVFVSQTNGIDGPLHRALDELIGQQSMIALEPSQLQNLIEQAAPGKIHPVYRLAGDEELEDIALGGAEVLESVLSRPRRRKVSAAELAKARDAASAIGLQGESFVNEYFVELKSRGVIQDFEWVSALDAISPFDFWYTTDGRSRILLDVKSTEIDYTRVLHLSYSELLQMAKGTERYDIYRVYGMSDGHASLRIAEDTRSFAQQTLSVLGSLPEHVFADSISFPPDVLTFGDVIPLSISELNSDE